MSKIKIMPENLPEIDWENNSETYDYFSFNELHSTKVDENNEDQEPVSIGQLYNNWVSNTFYDGL